ncbi:hypothetical protein PybrP1_004677 [[Pythium] brassicae (nom. inval.)]|nr:hypothetical protein PybrP1_004677 [[Pythium] brassicae (nom. inval.)]
MGPRRASIDDSDVALLALTQPPTAACEPLTQLLPPVRPACTRLFLCRHGQTEFNRLHKFQGRGVNTALNDTGRAQARQLAHALRGVPLRAAYSSTLRRARETAAIVAQLHPKLALQQFADLEEMSFGVFEGNAHALFDDQVQAIHHRWEAGDFEARFPSGENPLEVVARGVARIRALLLAAVPGDHVLVVTHGRFNKVVLAHLLHGELRKMHDLPQDNTCVNVVDFDHATGAFVPVLLNYTGHLLSAPVL